MLDPAALTGLLLVLGLAGAAAQPTSRWEDLSAAARPLEAVEPTPAGEGHVGLVPSGATIQLRFPVPPEPMLGYWLSLANMVAYSGKGSSYQLLLRRDGPEGAVVYRGAVFRQGDEWNASHGSPVDLTEHLTAADRERGSLDIYATGIVADDGWTLYRHRPQQPMLAFAVTETEDTRQQAAVGKAMEARGVAILPAPRQIEFTQDTLVLPAGTRIVVPDGAPARIGSAAQELHDLVLERTGVEWVVTGAAQPGSPGIEFTVAAPDSAAAATLPPQAESYVLTSAASGVSVAGRDAAGCFYGAMTLGQMAQPAPGGGVALPCGRIRDWPAFPLRLIQYDVARGQTIDVAYVKRMIRELARCKINGLVFYLEDDFQFRQYPFLGRPGTFTHAKALELAPYARRYGVQLIPQFEALGHGAAVLQHSEMAALREGGDPWVFCSSAPETWAFFDAVFGELVEAFPDSAFIHTGGDEFEPCFGVCERCRATVAQRGIGGLYADHMNRLNALVRKHGRTMLFWPSHSGPTPTLSDMSLQYQNQLEKDCIPTEWIYHGPPTYPTIEAYQKAGFKDVFCSPAVESYSRIWPDHVTSLRGIRGFYRAGAERGCGGAYCTTWEFMHGALWENSWYGLLFAAECSWNPNGTRRSEFTRRFADVWWGITPADEAVAARLDGAVFDPLPSRGRAGLWHSGVHLRDLLWAAPQRVLRDAALKQPEVAANRAELDAAVAAASAHLESLAPRIRHNALTLRAARLGFALIHYASAKLRDLQQASASYHDALAADDGARRVARLGESEALLLGLQRHAAVVAGEYQHFVTHCGAYAGDAEGLRVQAAEFGRLAALLATARSAPAAEQMALLPAAADLGFLRGSYTAIGEWLPAQMREDKASLRLDITPFVKAPGAYEVEWEYRRGAHALAIMSVQILVAGQVVAEDRHDGVTGAAHSQNSYHLVLRELPPGATVELLAETASRGGTDSYGTIWLVTATAAEDTAPPAPAWPLCTIRPAGAGGPAIVIDGHAEAPLWLALNNQFQRDEAMLDEVRLAHGAGIDHLGFLVYLDAYWTAARAAQTIDMFCSRNPAAAFYIQVWLGPNDAWKQAHPGDLMTKANGARMDYASIASLPWRTEATAQLRRRLGDILSGPHANRFMGVELQYLNTAEWFYPETNDDMDYSEANTTHWRTWLRRTYADDAALQRAWGDATVTLTTAPIPAPALRHASAWGPWRDPVHHRPAIDLQRCQSELVADTIAHFAAVAKDATQRRSLVSVFYGYTMELVNNGPRALPQSGHLALRRLLECPDLDIVRAPYSYFERGLGQPGHLHSPAHSIAAHGKLALFDDDSYTHLARAPEGPIIAPGWPDRTTTLEETLSLNRRNALNFLGCGAGVSWYDLLSDARWSDPAIWQSAAEIRAIATAAMGRPAFAPEVAFLVDEESVHLTHAEVYPELLHGVSWCRAELDRLGAPVGYWLLSDATALPATTRFIIVANAWRLEDAVRRNLLERIAAGAVVLWVRAPDVWGEAGADPARIEALTGLPVRARFETTTPARFLCAPTGYRIDFEQQRWEPCFVVEPRADVEVLARYETTNESAAAMVRSGAGWSAYTAFPRLPVPTLRLLCERAGVHLYRDTEGSTAVVGDYLVIHTAAAATHRLRWPRPCEAVERLVPAAEEPLARHAAEWTDDLPAGTTAIYHCTGTAP